MRNKILHVIGRMDRGGVETWLMHVLRHMDHREFEFQFLVQTEEDSAYDAEIRSLGGQIHYGGNPRNAFQYAAQFKGVVRLNGPFLAVHSHVYFYSGWIMKQAWKLAIPVRVAHSHTARKRGTGLQRQLYETLMRHWLSHYATHRVAVSPQAGQALFGGPFTVVPYGIDFAPFHKPSSQADINELKCRYGIPAGRKVIGHVGRFVPEKNHEFIVETFRELLNKGIDAHLLLVGSGPLLGVVQQEIDALGLSNRCAFAGLQPLVVPFLRAMDIVLLPSHWEGLGIVGLESQAAGVPLLASMGVPTDLDVIPEFVEHIPLSQGPASWASAIERRLKQQNLKRGDELKRLESSKFGLQSAMQLLFKIYTERPQHFAAL